MPDQDNNAASDASAQVDESWLYRYQTFVAALMALGTAIIGTVAIIWTTQVELAAQREQFKSLEKSRRAEIEEQRNILAKAKAEEILKAKILFGNEILQNFYQFLSWRKKDPNGDNILIYTKFYDLHLNKLILLDPDTISCALDVYESSKSLSGNIIVTASEGGKLEKKIAKQTRDRFLSNHLKKTQHCIDLLFYDTSKASEVCNLFTTLSRIETDSLGDSLFDTNMNSCKRS